MAHVNLSHILPVYQEASCQFLPPPTSLPRLTRSVVGRLYDLSLHLGEVVGESGLGVDVVGVNCTPAGAVDGVNELGEGFFRQVAFLPLPVVGSDDLAHPMLDGVEEDEGDILELEDLADEFLVFLLEVS